MSSRGSRRFLHEWSQEIDVNNVIITVVVAV